MNRLVDGWMNKQSIYQYWYFSPQNLIAQSQSGTGKTGAFVLAMLSRVDPTKDHPQVQYFF